jgi:DNA-binding SARP family transcriptional activator
VEYRILGPIEVLDYVGEPVPLGGPKQRALLALLLLHANEVVSADRLMDGLWGDELPDTAKNTIQVYVSQLRKIIRAAGAVDRALITQLPGYRLTIADESLDLNRFGRLTAEGRDALARGAADVASVRLRDALAIWRGEPLVDFSYEPFAQAEIERLLELRLAAIEDRFEADLERGVHTALVGDLEALVRAHPRRERLRGHLMIALYRSGRQEDALEVYRAAADRMGDDLGIDPGPELQRVHQAVLRQEPWLEAPARVTPPVEEEPPAMRPSIPSPSRELREGEMTTIVAVAVAVDDPGQLRAAMSGDQIDAVLQELGSRLRRPFEEVGARIVAPASIGFVALFGLPVAGDDDAERASGAALGAARIGTDYAYEIRQGWGVRGPGVRIAVAAGRVAGTAAEAEDPASSPRQIATALSADAAPGTVVLGRSMVERLPSPFVHGPWGERNDGQLLLGTDRSRVPTSPFVDRGDELDQGLRALQDVRNGRGRILLLAGEAGIGKSRLLAELRADAPDVTWLEGSCSSLEGGTPFQPFVEMLRSWLGVTADTDSGGVRRRLSAGMRTIGSFDAATMSILEGLLTETRAKGSAQQIGDAVAAWLRGLAGNGPLAATFEDLHAVDEGTAAVFPTVLRVTDFAPLLLALTIRSETEGEAASIRMSALTDLRHRAEELRLGPLQDADAAVLADALSKTGTLDPGSREELVRRAGGNPLFLGELVRNLSESGGLEPRGRWTLSLTTMATMLPPSLEGLLVARVHRLPAEARRAAQVAAVIGPEFEVPLLERALGGSAQEALGALLRAELVREVRRVPEPTLAFNHSMLQDGALATLTPAKAKEVYGIVARAAEELYPASLDERSEQLALYFYRSSEPDRAIPYLERSAERAEAVGAHERALELRARASRAAALGDQRRG